MSISPENVRFHAAGHIAAALLLVESGQAKSAQTILDTVKGYVDHDKVNAPPQLKEKLNHAISAPNSADLRLLEQWFVDPLNTEIEKSAA